MRVETRPHPAGCRGNRHPERNTSDTLPRLGDCSESAGSWLELGSPVSRGLQRPRTDRSEIGPYLGSHWATSQSPTTNPALSVNLRGMAISPKAPTSADTDHRRHGPSQTRTIADMDRRRHGPSQTGTIADRDHRRHGPSQTWTVADMDHRRARPLGGRSFPGSSMAPSASLLLAGITPF